jgi:hypothetical protein
MQRRLLRDKERERAIYRARIHSDQLLTYRSRKRESRYGSESPLVVGEAGAHDRFAQCFGLESVN